jgi:hypothetical protein
MIALDVAVTWYKIRALIWDQAMQQASLFLDNLPSSASVTNDNNQESSQFMKRLCKHPGTADTCLLSLRESPGLVLCPLFLPERNLCEKGQDAKDHSSFFNSIFQACERPCGERLI